MTHTLNILNPKTGDDEFRWEGPGKEQDEARAAFDAARAKGMMAYTFDVATQTGEHILGFDPSAERIVLTRPMVGG